MGPGQCESTWCEIVASNQMSDIAATFYEHFVPNIYALEGCSQNEVCTCEVAARCFKAAFYMAIRAYSQLVRIEKAACPLELR